MLLFGIDSKSSGIQRVEALQCVGAARVAKCHGYDGFIRVKKLASWSKKFGRPKLLPKTSHFWEDMCKKLRSMDKLP